MDYDYNKTAWYTYICLLTYSTITDNNSINLSLLFPSSLSDIILYILIWNFNTHLLYVTNCFFESMLYILLICWCSQWDSASIAHLSVHFVLPLKFFLTLVDGEGQRMSHPVKALWDKLWFVTMGYTIKIWLIDWWTIVSMLTPV